MLELLLYFIGYFIVCYYLNRFWFWLRSRKEELKLVEITEFSYFVNKYHLDLKLIGLTKISKLTSFYNALILTINLIIIKIWGLTIPIISVCFILIIILTFVIYHLIGSYYRKKGMIINV